MVDTAKPIAASLRFAYLFNEGTGTTVNDRSGNGLNGTISSAPVRITGPVGNNGYIGTYLDFDGADDLVTTMDPVHPTEYTMVVLCRLDASVSAGVFVRTDGDPSTYSHLLAINAGNWRAYMFDGAQKTITDPAFHVVNEWVHVVATAKNGGMLRLYVNGVEAATPVSVNTLWTGGNRWWVGRNGNSYAFWNGAVDHVYYYTRELSAGEIATLAADNYALFPSFVAPVPPGATVRGNIDYDQFRLTARHGNGTQIQMHYGPSVAGHFPVYTADGSLVDSGESAVLLRGDAPEPLAAASERGRIDYDETRLSARHGDGTQVQMQDGASVAGHVPVYAADGSLTDSGMTYAEMLAARKGS